MKSQIQGKTAGEIVESVRDLVERGVLLPGDHLPTVRRLAEDLGVNRNTVVSAYRQLTVARVTVSRTRAGTSIAMPAVIREEGFAEDTVLRDVGSGNPDPDQFPNYPLQDSDFSGSRVLYGESTLDADLAQWATSWFEADSLKDFSLTVTAGAVDAVERLLGQSLNSGDSVAIEDPCFLASIKTIATAGYTPLAVEVDDEGMSVEGLTSALASGARAVVCTPRAHNPTGVSTSADRAQQLRVVLSSYPNVMVIADDHFSLLAKHPYSSIIGSAHQRWALVRSVSKFLGPDLRLAVVASDHMTADRLALRISPGTTWVSHLLQKLAHLMLTSPGAQGHLTAAADHYARRNSDFIRILRDRGIAAVAQDGLNVWISCVHPGTVVVENLSRHGWLARPGNEFALSADGPSANLRVTAHDLTDAEMVTLADALAQAIEEAGKPTGTETDAAS